MKRIKKSGYTLLMNTIIFILGFPLIVLVIWSFTKRWPWPCMFPKAFGIRSFQYMISPGSNTLQVLIGSIWLSIVVTLITLLISIPAARALGIYHFKGKKLFKMAILAPIIVPPVATGMGIHVAFIKMGLVNTFMGVVLVHLIPCLPYGVRILTNTFEITGKSMEMQAKVLGASGLQAFFYITLPLIAPGLMAASSLVFIVSFSQYFLTFLIGGGNVITFSMMMFPYIQSGDRMMASAYSLVFVLTIFVLLIVMEKIVKRYYKTHNHFYI